MKFFLLISLFISNFSFAADGKSSWSNKGGMWMPSQMVEHAETLKQLGLEIDPKLLSNPSSDLLKAIVSLGGCSGSFISKSGLIITNHHCVESILAYRSQVEREKGSTTADFVTTGFLAKNRSEEKYAGPTQKIYITTHIEDVTTQVLDGIDEIKDPAEKSKTVEARVKDLVKKSEAKNPALKSELKSFFRGEKYFLIERLKLDDIRIVYAPPKNVGYFGGDRHNWHYPRFVGDFALLRAYVAPNGSPAAYSEDNVPYVPEEIFEVSRAGIYNDDLIFVAGFPGRTERLHSSHEFAKEVKTDIPALLDKYNGLFSLLEKLAKTDKSLDVKTSSTRFSLSNVLKNKTEALKAITKLGLVEKKADLDHKMQAWIDSDHTRMNQYGGILEEMKKLVEKDQPTTKTKLTSDLFSQTSMIASAISLVRKAEQAELPDDKRLPQYQDREADTFWAGQQRVQSTYDRRINIEVLSFFINRILKEAPEDRPDILADFIGQDGDKLSEAEIKVKLDELYSKSKMEDLTFRKALFNAKSLDELKSIAGNDSLIEIAFKFLPFVRAEYEKSYIVSGEAMPVVKKYVQAVREFKMSQGELLAPDANSTLRITFGLVKGKHKTSDGKLYAPFTNVSQMIHTQHNPEDNEFTVPENVLNAAKSGLHEPFADPMYGEVPIDFLANVDTTGGNSGSAALDKNGRLIGLLFDGEEEALYSDWHFDDGVRSILVDMRYFLWTLYNVEGADHLLKEMVITPSCDEILIRKK